MEDICARNPKKLNNFQSFSGFSETYDLADLVSRTHKGANEPSSTSASVIFASVRSPHLPVLPAHPPEFAPVH